MHSLLFSPINSTSANSKPEVTDETYDFTLTLVHQRRPVWIGNKNVLEMISQLILSLLQYCTKLENPNTAQPSIQKLGFSN